MSNGWNPRRGSARRLRARPAQQPPVAEQLSHRRPPRRAAPALVAVRRRHHRPRERGHGDRDRRHCVGRAEHPHRAGVGAAPVDVLPAVVQRRLVLDLLVEMPEKQRAGRLRGVGHRRVFREHRVGELADRLLAREAEGHEHRRPAAPLGLVDERLHEPARRFDRQTARHEAASRCSRATPACSASSTPRSAPASALACTRRRSSRAPGSRTRSVARAFAAPDLAARVLADTAEGVLFNLTADDDPRRPRPRARRPHHPIPRRRRTASGAVTRCITATAPSARASRSTSIPTPCVTRSRPHLPEICTDLRTVPILLGHRSLQIRPATRTSPRRAAPPTDRTLEYRGG
jgi:hypothetical protein